MPDTKPTKDNPVVWEDVRAKDKTDDRVRKRYDRLVFFGVRTFADNRHIEPSSQAVALKFRERLASLTSFPAMDVVDTVVGSTHWAWWPGHRDCTWHVALRVPKPSLIPDEATAVKWGREIALPLLKQAYEEALVERAEQLRRKTACEEAAQLMSWGAQTALERAKDICRYAARLAALKAELEVEIQQQVAKMKRDDDLTKAAAQSETHDFEPEAVAWAAEHFEQAVKGWDSPFSHTLKEPSEADLFPDEDEDEDDADPA